MNRREFFQTAALFCAGSICAGSARQGRERIPRFRAQKMFLESWKNSTCSVSFVREKLEHASDNGCNGLLLVPDRCSLSKWEKLITVEGNRLGLTVFSPIQLTGNFFRNIHSVAPLANETGILQNIDGIPSDNGGFLLSDRSDNVLGIVLYDSSRCLWSGFMPMNAETEQHTVCDANDSRLVVARWLDYVRALS